jgi:gliding motility-associated-like protein
VSVTDASGCGPVVTPNISISEPVIISITSSNKTDATCNGGTNGTITVAATGGTGTLTYTLNPGAVSNTTGVFSGLGAGTYTVSVMDASGCGPVVTPNISISEPVVISITSSNKTDATCNGGANGTITVVATGGTGTLTYTLSPGAVSNTTGVFSGLGAGTYTVSVTDDNACGPIVTPDIIIDEPVLMVATIGVNIPSTICSGTSANLKVTITGGTSPYSFTIDNGVGAINNYVSDTPISVSPGSTTTYSIVGNVTDASGCNVSGSGNATVTVNPSPASATLTGTASICAGSSTDLKVTITGGTSPYKIIINKGIGSINNYVSDTPIPVSPASTTTYDIVGVVTDASGCTVTGTGSAVVTVKPLPTATISGTATICNGSSTNVSITFTGTPPWSYQYSDGTNTFGPFSTPGNVTFTVNPSVNTAYTVVSVSDNSVCSGTVAGSAVVTVNQNPQTNLTVGVAINPLCNGGSTDISIANSEVGVSYQLRNDADNSLIGSAVTGTGGTINLNTGVLATTTQFNIMATSTGCTPVVLLNKPTVNVGGTIDATLAVSALVDPLCSGSSTSIRITSSETGVNYQLRNDAGDVNIGSAVAGTGGDIDLPTGALVSTTIFNILADNGTCSIELTNLQTINVDINPNAALTVGVTIDPVCNGGISAITINNSEIGVSYQLRDDADNSNINTAVAGTGGTINLPTTALSTTTTFNVLASGGAACSTTVLTTKPVVSVSGTIDISLGIAAVDDPICSGTSTFVRITNSENGITYQLRNDADDSTIGSTVIGTGADLDLPTGNLNTTTSFNIFANNGSCSIELTNKATVNVEVNPDASLVTSATIDPLCTGGTSGVRIQNSEVGVMYQLRNDFDDSLIGSAIAGTGGSIVLPTGIFMATTTFNVLASSGAICPSVELTSLVTVNVSGTVDASLTTTATPATICANSSTFVQIANSEIGITYQLRNDADESNVNTAVSGTGGTINLPTGNLAATTVFNVLASNGSCSIELTDKETVTVSPSPNAALTVSANPNLVCSGTGSVITVNASESGVTYELRKTSDNSLVSTVNGTGGDITFPTGSLLASTDYKVMAILGTCSLQLTATVTVTVRAVGDPACGGGGGSNCFAFATSGPVVEVRPSCANQNDGQLTFNIKGGSGAYVVTLYDSVSTPIFTQAKVGSSASPITFASLSPSNTYFYKINDGVNVCTLPYSLPLQTTVTATADVNSFGNAQCFGDPTGTVIINASGSSTGQYWYSIDDVTWKQFVPGNAGEITDLPPNGTYTILVGEVANDACYDTAKVTINNANPKLKATFAKTAASCNGNDGTITNLVGSGGVSSATYVFTVDGNPGPFDALSGGSHTLTISDGVCSIDSMVTIIFPGQINFTVLTEEATCDNPKSGKITVIFDADGFDYRVGVSKNPIVEPTEYLDDPANSQFFPIESLTGGDYYVFVKSPNSACPSRQGPFTVNGPVGVEFAISSVCTDSKASVKLENINASFASDASGLTLTVLNNLDQPVVDVPLGFPVLTSYILGYDDPLYTAFTQIPGEYKITLTQTQFSPSFCVVKSETTTYNINAPLIASTGAVTESYPDVPTGTLQVKSFAGGAEPYNIRIELVAPDPLSEIPSYQTNWTEVTKNKDLLYEADFNEIPAGEYLVQIVDSLGCEFDLEEVIVPVDTDIFIPNVFTPNGDDKNPDFHIRNLPTSQNVKLIVSNKWGNEVYSSNNYQNNWNGDGAADGIYYYSLQIGSDKPITGWVEIMRGQQP